jgi:hypothetical protein
MPQSGRAGRQDDNRGGALALFPLGLVFAGIVFLAVGAGRTPTSPAPAQQAATSASTIESAAADEAAAAAVIAISLARVAPQLPESALEPPAPKPTPEPKQATAEAPRKAAAPRDAAAKPPNPPTSRPAAAQQAPKPQDAAQPSPVETKPADEGFLARIGSYAPSPKKIAGAVSEGVSKIASYIPGL